VFNKKKGLSDATSVGFGLLCVRTDGCRTAQVWLNYSHAQVIIYLPLVSSNDFSFVLKFDHKKHFEIKGHLP
jgi:hypothetical protein